MIVQIWIVMAPGGDRPYVSTTPPSLERYTELKRQGCKVYRTDAYIQGWEYSDGRVGCSVEEDLR